MKVDQLYTGCLAEAAYYLESNGEAAIIDPLRDVDSYIQMAQERGAKIKYIFETHFHADFVSGHLDLAAKTGALIVYGPTAKTGYPAYQAEDGEEFQLGDATIRVLHTPGHTLESSCYLLLDKDGKQQSIFTGDTLFIGDVGRPDLAVKSDLTQEDLAGMLYDSLWNKVMTLGDELVVYPGHGAGSSCGKSMSAETFDTLGNQKKVNYALQPMPKQDFVEKVTHGILPPPQYFSKNAMLNKSGYESWDVVMGRGNKALSLEQVEEHLAKGALLLDTRDQQEFNKGYVQGSMNIGLGGMFAIWVGTLIQDLKQPIVLIAEEGRGEEAVMRLARVGYDNAVGYLDGGFATWKNAGKPVEAIPSITPQEFETIFRTKGGKVNVLDVRTPTEFLSQRLINAENFPLNFVNESLDKLDKNQEYFVHCKSGYKSMITSSILKRAGIKNVVDIQGGFDAIAAQTELEKTDYVCPSTL